MDISIFYASLGTVSLIIVLGFILGKSALISEHTNKQLINLLLSIFWPAALLLAFPQRFDSTVLSDFLWGLCGGALVLLLLIFLSHLIFHRRFFGNNLSYEGQFALIFNNASFLGYPLILVLFPETIIAYCGFILVFNIALFSYGVWLFKREFNKTMWVSIISNPCILAVIVGAILFFVSLSLPEFINSGLRYLGGVMTPLSLICIGYMLSQANFSTLLTKKKLFLTAAIQLLLGPTVTFLILWLIGVPENIRDMLVLIQALPTATSLGLFAEKYDGNSIEASELVAISTLLSIITLPIMIGLLVI